MLVRGLVNVSSFIKHPDAGLSIPASGVAFCNAVFSVPVEPFPQRRGNAIYFIGLTDNARTVFKLAEKLIILANWHPFGFNFCAVLDF